MENLYSNTKECPTPVEGQVQGTIPTWLNGSLYRNGPGMYKVGDSEYNYSFDGLALLHHFQIQNGKVTYRNRFIRSETYKRNMKANRIIVSEFGTTAYPDPCKNIFQRMFAWFLPDTISDNTLVTVTPCSDYLYTSTETNIIHKVDPKTLETLSANDISQYVAVNLATAHFHRDPDGTLHNLGHFFKGRPKHSIIKVPPPKPGKEIYEEAEVVGSICCRWPFHPSYIHSFGMSENYYVIVEQPLVLNVKSMVAAKFTSKPFCDCFQWFGEYKNVFHIIDKKTGERLNPETRYVAEPFFMFHHINTYEEDGCVVVDLVAFEDAKIIDFHSLKNLRSEERMVYPSATVRRYVLPLQVNREDLPGTAYDRLKTTQATAVKQEGRCILCTHETLTDTKGVELPQINYEKYNGRKYRYIYAGAGYCFNKIVKIDTEEKSSVLWSDGDIYTSEPVFVPSPEATAEDDGVVLAVLYKIAEPHNLTYLLVLDASTMKELGRVEFPVQLSPDIHGVFLPETTSL